MSGQLIIQKAIISRSIPVYEPIPFHSVLCHEAPEQRWCTQLLSGQCCVFGMISFLEAPGTVEHWRTWYHAACRPFSVVAPALYWPTLHPVSLRISTRHCQFSQVISKWMTVNWCNVSKMTSCRWAAVLKWTVLWGHSDNSSGRFTFLTGQFSENTISISMVVIHVNIPLDQLMCPSQYHITVIC